MLHQKCYPTPFMSNIPNARLQTKLPIYPMPFISNSPFLKPTMLPNIHAQYTDTKAQTQKYPKQLPSNTVSTDYIPTPSPDPVSLHTQATSNHKPPPIASASPSPSSGPSSSSYASSSSTPESVSRTPQSVLFDSVLRERFCDIFSLFENIALGARDQKNHGGMG